MVRETFLEDLSENEGEPGCPISWRRSIRLSLKTSPSSVVITARFAGRSVIGKYHSFWNISETELTNLRCKINGKKAIKYWEHSVYSILYLTIFICVENFYGLKTLFRILSKIVILSISGLDSIHTNYFSYFILAYMSELG